MRGIPRRLADISDLDLLTLACEPGFLEGRTALELALIERLEMSVRDVELARAGEARLLDAL